MKRIQNCFLTAALFVAGGCAAVTGDSYTVGKTLAEMSPTARAINVGSNRDLYEKNYGIFYDSFSDALYRKSPSGERQYILEGNVFRAITAIDTGDKKSP